MQFAVISAEVVDRSRWPGYRPGAIRVETTIGRFIVVQEPGALPTLPEPLKPHETVVREALHQAWLRSLPMEDKYPWDA